MVSLLHRATIKK